jgi:hypothetical protein
MGGLRLLLGAQRDRAPIRWLIGVYQFYIELANRSSETGYKQPSPPVQFCVTSYSRLWTDVHTLFVATWNNEWEMGSRECGYTTLCGSVVGPRIGEVPGGFLVTVP